MLRGKLAKAAAVGALGLAGVLGVQSAASAYVFGDYTAPNVKIRSGPSQAYRIYGSGYPGDYEYDWCYTTGQSIYGNIFWDWNTNYTTGTTGYSSEYYLTSGASQFTHC